MSIVNADSLGRYLELHGKNPYLAELANFHMQPLLVMADEGPDLARVSELDMKVVAKAISSAVGRRVHSVQCISLREITWSPDAMYEAVEEMRANRSTDLEWCVRGKVQNHLWNLFASKKRGEDQDERMIDHMSTLMSALTTPMKWSLRKEVERQLCETMNRDVWSMELNVGGGIEQVILDYVGYLVLGRKRLARKFEPLIKLFPETIPLYEETDNLGHWVTLTA